MGWGWLPDLAWGTQARIYMLHLNRKVQDLRVAVEPELSGYVMVAVCWCLALTGEDSGTTIPRLST